MLNTGTIPEDCDTLVIPTPTQDFDELTATKIIEYRKTQKFLEIEDIMNVSGIGNSKFDKIKDNIEVD